MHKAPHPRRLCHISSSIPMSGRAHMRTCCAQAALCLSVEQAEAIREAHGHFLARQRALAQQRCQALPYLQKALYSSCDLATHKYMGCASLLTPCVWVPGEAQSASVLPVRPSLLAASTLLAACWSSLVCPRVLSVLNLQWHGCRIHEAEAKVRGSMDEECDNICRLSCFVVSRVLTDWQVALLYVRTYPWAAHVMVRLVVGSDTPAHAHSLHIGFEHERPSHHIWGSIRGTAAKISAAHVSVIWLEN